MGYNPYRNDPPSSHVAGYKWTNKETGRDLFLSSSHAVRVCYTNHEGKTAWRHIIPLPVPPVFGTAYHPDEWCIAVYDIDKGAERHYALSGIHHTFSPVQFDRLSEDQKQNWLMAGTVNFKLHPRG